MGSNGSSPEDLHEWLSFEDPDEDRTWVFDLSFLLSRWTCIYGRGCQGVLTEAAPELEHGCCSYGAHLTGDADRRRVQRSISRLTADDWQMQGVAARKGGPLVQERSGAWRTRVHDGACIMLNRPGFPGGAGCALHRSALVHDERPLDRKPEVCWQLPLRRTDATDEVGHVTSTVREWKRRDWGGGGSDFHWWCTESADAFIGDQTVLRTMEDELVAMVGRKVYDRLLSAVAQRCTSTTVLPHPAVRRAR